jgi:hypothetical protein
MATQSIVDNFKYNGGYLDAGMSVQTIDELQSLSRSSLFTGRTITVISAIVTEGGKSIPADFWLSEGKTKSYWTLKDIAPIDDISQMSSIPSDYIPNGFEVVTKSGEKYKFDTTVESGEPKWEKYTYEGGDVNVDEVVEDVLNRVTSGATEAFDTFKEVEDWISNHSCNNGISEDIEVNGGEWADEVETVFDGKIPAGITFEEFLRKMVKSEKYSEGFTSENLFNVFCEDINPGVTAGDKDVNEQIVEVGTKITLGKIEPSKTVFSQTLVAGPFKYGYKVGEDGEFVNSTSYTETLHPIQTKTGNTLQVLFNNLVDNVENGSALTNVFMTEVQDGDNISIEPITAYVNKGYNSITINYTGDSYTSVAKTTDLYVATNLKNYYQKDEVTPNICKVLSGEIEKHAMIQTQYHITGASQYFIGGINDYSEDYWSSNRSTEIKQLEVQGWAIDNTISVPYTYKEGTKQQTVAVPSEYTKVSGRDMLNGPVTFHLVKENMNFYNAQGYVSKYNIFVAPVYDGLSVDSFINITISK